MVIFLSNVYLVIFFLSRFSYLSEVVPRLSLLKHIIISEMIGLSYKNYSDDLFSLPSGAIPNPVSRNIFLAIYATTTSHLE